MVFQSDFDAAVAAYDPLDTTQAAPDINMYYNSVSTESSTIYNQMYQVLMIMNLLWQISLISMPKKV